MEVATGARTELEDNPARMRRVLKIDPLSHHLRRAPPHQVDGDEDHGQRIGDAEGVRTACPSLMPRDTKIRRNLKANSQASQRNFLWKAS
jgi:hypothetical protein